MHAPESGQYQAVIKVRHSQSGNEWTGNRVLPVPRTCNSCPYLTRIEVVVVIKLKIITDKINPFSECRKNPCYFALLLKKYY
jgi:hypothetical protein